MRTYTCTHCSIRTERSRADRPTLRNIDVFLCLPAIAQFIQSELLMQSMYFVLQLLAVCRVLGMQLEQPQPLLHQRVRRVEQLKLWQVRADGLQTADGR